MKRNYFLWVILIAPYLFLVFGYFLHKNIIHDIPESRVIIINKDDYSLKLFSYKGELLGSFRVGIGANIGNKIKTGDKKTPEGIFRILKIEDSREWSYDFEGDSMPEIKGAYGPWFMRLDANGFRSIGIHGTLDVSTLGKRTSQGCIRMKNEELELLKKQVILGTLVIILPSILDVEANQRVNIH
jgi:lipoprotein-anchoring transpeptidase ErfK/SrfK